MFPPNLVLLALGLPHRDVYSYLRRILSWNSRRRSWRLSRRLCGWARSDIQNPNQRGASSGRSAGPCRPKLPMRPRGSETDGPAAELKGKFAGDSSALKSQVGAVVQRANALSRDQRRKWRRSARRARSAPPPATQRNAWRIFLIVDGIADGAQLRPDALPFGPAYRWSYRRESRVNTLRHENAIRLSFRPASAASMLLPRDVADCSTTRQANARLAR